jgi:polar amino acid transport system substrate-binding protein
MKKLILFLTLILFNLLGNSSILKAAQWSEIEKRGQLIIAVKDNYRPLGFRDDQGNLQGLEIDIARRLAQDLLGDGNAVELIAVQNQDRLNLVLNGTVDLAIARVSITPSRTRVVNFSSFYYWDPTGFITNNAQIQSIQDLRFKKIAVLNYSNTIPVVRNRLPEAQLIGVDSYLEAFYGLESGQFDAFAGDYSLITGWMQEFPMYHRLTSVLSGEALAIVMPKGLQYLELSQKVNSAISQWQQEGWLEERINYYQLTIDG